MLSTTIHAGGQSDTAPGNHLSLGGGGPEDRDKAEGKGGAEAKAKGGAKAKAKGGAEAEAKKQEDYCQEQKGVAFQANIPLFYLYLSI